MLLARSARLAQRPAQSTICLGCQYRTFITSSPRLLADKSAKKSAATPQPPQQPSPAAAAANPTQQQPPKPVNPLHASPLEDAPRSYGKRVEHFEPKPLPRPIGMPYPPLPGENTGIDNRTIKQRRDDFVDYDKHLQRRQELKSKMARPYFRDWGNLQFSKGKSFIAPPRPFRGDVSLFFPNLYGQTLVKNDKEPRDTTPTLAGKISVVSLFSGVWAENQTRSFVGDKENLALAKIVEGETEKKNSPLQNVQVNIEEDSLKFWLIKMFMGGVRSKTREQDWDKYFIVRRGISEEIKESIGLLNSKVGYVYLVDSDCRIRWAGSADATAEEREGLAKSVQRLLDEEAKKPKEV